MSRGALPTFVTVGAMKCGTTSLHAHLSRHPDISMSARKELDFFSNERRYRQGLDWYAAQFDGTQPIRGESSPNYAKRHIFPHSARRLTEALPEARLIYLVRDPARRFFSNYLHALAAGFEHRDLDTVLDERGHNYEVLLRTGQYLWQLEAYLEHVPRERVLVLSSEELDRAPDATLATVFAFIGADPQRYPPRVERRWHQSQDKSMPRAWTRPLLRQPLMAPLLKRLPKGWTRGPMPSVQWSETQGNRLRDLYRDEVRRLREWLGRPELWPDY